MGVILYEMFAGSAPFQAETLPEVCARIMAEPPPPLRQLKPDVPAALESVVMRCLDKDVTRRFQDVGALAMALAPFGAPEARVAAERIGRLARSAQGSAPDLRPDASGPAQPMTAQAASGIAQTSASFGTVRPARSPRSPALPFAIGGGAVALVAIAVVGLIAVRGKHAAASAAGTAATSAPVATAPAATPTATDKTTESATPRIGALPPSSEAATASGAPTPTPPPSPAPPLPAHPAGPATATGLANQGKTAPRPKATTSAAPAPRPAGTNGFGGRD
jgi:serine/threonine-protein kinase